MFDSAAALSAIRGAVGTAVSAVNSFSSASLITGLVGATNPIAGILISAAQAASGGGLRFPLDVATHGNYITFSPQATVGGAVGTINDFLSRIGASGLNPTVGGGAITLPLPSSLSVDYNPNYEVKELNAAVGQAIKRAEKGMYDGTGGTSAKELASKVGNTKTAVGILGGLGLGAAAGAIGEENLGAALKVLGGVAQNPHKILLFTGVDFRDHQFSWKLSPRNLAESNAIRDIIKTFVRSSHPDFAGGGLFLTYPDFFNIRIARSGYLYQFIPSVLTDVRVNYHGQGYAAYIVPDQGGEPAPAEVELSLTFKEVEIVTRSSVAAGGTGFGF